MTEMVSDEEDTAGVYESNLKGMPDAEGGSKGCDPSTGFESQPELKWDRSPKAKQSCWDDSVGKGLMSHLTSRVHDIGPTWQKERTNSYKLSSDLGNVYVPHTPKRDNN